MRKLIMKKVLRNVEEIHEKICKSSDENVKKFRRKFYEIEEKI